ncbi:MAG TPA: UDP-glucose 6-dehydrogenase, partial [Candidatus Aminicenantes bacterium]|nr:UDP-glucose 6-dehydrogenase [Candidatus Aminicenantes bacterium]
FDVVSNPEFLREGSAIEDTLRPDRIVIGAPTQQVAMTLLELYAQLGRPMIITDVPSAEMIKYASNAFLAAKISFINAIANICEAAGADVTQVMKGMGLDPRIGSRFLKAGIGYGGSCFPKDIKALVKIGEDLGVDMSLLKEADRINFDRVRVVLEKIKQALWILKDKRIAVLGLAFKPETDDIREAPSISIIRELVREGARLRLYDPQATENMKLVFSPEPGRLEYCASPYSAAEGTNALLLLTEWEEFAALDFDKLKETMANPIIIDGRNVFGPAALKKLGFEYYSIGRK